MPMVLFSSQGDYLVGAEIKLSTRQNKPIANERRMQRAPESMDAARKFVLTAHETARLRSLASVYNCLGMVFASRRTWVEPEELPKILSDDSYRKIKRTELQSGDVIIYRDDSNEVSHVGIVDEVIVKLEDGTKKVRVLSQWGADGEYFHLDYDVNPRLGQPSEYWTDRT